MRKEMPDISIFQEYESQVSTYCKHFPTVFKMAKNAILYSEQDKPYIDFFAGAGALNYGHNNEYIKGFIVEYIVSDGLTHGLDLYTTAKRQFIKKFSTLILKPRALDYKIQFCGPTGANAVEAALKLARKVKQRTGIFSFMGSFHGVSLGSLSVTSGHSYRSAAGLPLTNISFMPFPYGEMAPIDTIGYIEAVLTDTYSGIDKPAAIIVEAVQAEGGVIVASVDWLQQLRSLCDRHDILLICDEIQAGCGRTGPFFSFERAGIVPDIIAVSKSISGYGLPMSILLIKPDLDKWQPGEHTGTFRGNQLAFVGASAALDYREEFKLEQQVREKELFLERFLHEQIGSIDERILIRGIGLLWGIDLSGLGKKALAQQVSSRCFDRGLIIEVVGRENSVLKLIPPLTIELDVLATGCVVLKQVLLECIDELSTCTPILGKTEKG